MLLGFAGDCHPSRPEIPVRECAARVAAFNCAILRCRISVRDWLEHVQFDPQLVRQDDSRYTHADTGKVHRHFGWRASTSFDRIRIVSAGTVINGPATEG